MLVSVLLMVLFGVVFGRFGVGVVVRRRRVLGQLQTWVRVHFVAAAVGLEFLVLAMVLLVMVLLSLVVVSLLPL